MVIIYDSRLIPTMHIILTNLIMFPARPRKCGRCRWNCVAQRYISWDLSSFLIYFRLWRLSLIYDITPTLYTILSGHIVFRDNEKVSGSLNLLISSPKAEIYFRISSRCLGYIIYDYIIWHLGKNLLIFCSVISVFVLTTCDRKELCLLYM